MAKKPVATVDACCASVFDTPLTSVDADELAAGFAALADPVRLRLLSMIASTEEVCSCDCSNRSARRSPPSATTPRPSPTPDSSPATNAAAGSTGTSCPNASTPSVAHSTAR